MMAVTSFLSFFAGSILAGMIILAIQEVLTNLLDEIKSINLCCIHSRFALSNSVVLIFLMIKVQHRQLKIDAEGVEKSLLMRNMPVVT